ncbi:YjbE family putative metal transport protein [Quisquiliibacterium transsilvanicum]|uniref:YjbE family integral membrane protein n=1 Tax=Quisquiliibacterium transsilvanicum TaxID=1549638 RepID=A0A7W8HJY4_9BURK|nr:YjbE family integral membrane protein [Quisquiliibacterium transsilvanicum]
MIEFLTTLSWAAVLQIIIIDILLGGDNAVVIALACRNLPPHQRTKGILWGTAGAIVLRVILIAFAVTLLQVPFLKLVGGALLIWIGMKLLVPENEDAHGNLEGSGSLMGAIKTVIVADLVMSVDNVIAIAGAAQQADPDHQLGLVIFGLLVSIPLIVWGSQLVLKLIDRFPLVVLAGAALLGWIAGGMMITDIAVVGQIGEPSSALKYGASALGALLVVALGEFAKRRQRGRARPAH